MTISFTIAEIARALDATFAGDGEVRVTGACEPSQATPDTLALAMSETYAAALAKGRAQTAVLWEGADWEQLGLRAAIFVGRPRLAMSALTRTFDPGPDSPPGIHDLAVVDPSARIGAGASVGPFVAIGRDVEIGKNVRIAANATIGAGVRIGDDALIGPGVRIMARVRIGHRTIIHANAVIGSDGFSFVTPEKSAVEEVRETLGERIEIKSQAYTRIHSLGSVEIGDDVEIGAGSAIDAGTVAPTRIGRGTKLDNLVQIGHNCQVGEDTLLCGQVGLAGSARIGNRVVLGGQCGVSDNISVGDDVIAGGNTKIYTNAPAGRVLMGSPATKMETQIEIYKAQRRLPRLVARLSELEKTVSKLRKTD